MTWLRGFTQQVTKHDHGLFYGAVADLTLQWLQIDIKGLHRDYK